MLSFRFEASLSLMNIHQAVVLYDRDPVGRAGRLVRLEHWKELTIWRLESLSASVSSSLWIVIMRFVAVVLSFLLK